MKNLSEPAHEVNNPDFNDLTLEQQEFAGINDWVAVDKAGRKFFAKTREEADAMCREYNRHRK